METNNKLNLRNFGLICGRLSFIVSFLAVFLTLSCQDEEVAPLNELGTQSISKLSSEGDAVLLLQDAANNQNNGAQPYEQALAFPFFNPCTNELVDWTAVIRGVIHSHEDAQGKLHYQYILMITNAKGSSESGMNYVGTGMFDFVIHSNENGEALTITNQIHQNFISKGAAPNAVLTFFLHTTINANGEIVSHKTEPVEISCI